MEQIVTNMTQKLVLKQEHVTIQEPKTLESLLREKLLQKGMDVNLLEKVANSIIFSVDNVMVKDLQTEIKTGQTVKLIPAVTGG